MIKEITKYITLLPLLILVLVSSCKKEEMEFIQEPDDTLNANALITQRILQTVTNDGSDDNILDS